MATYSSELEWSHPDYYNESEKKPMLSAMELGKKPVNSLPKR